MTFTSIQDIIVGVQAITTTFANGTTKTMSTDGFLATIDTNAAEIWLPRPICDIFESTFKLSYFDLAYRYTVNDTARAELQRTNPTISFRIGSAATGGDIITIDIPYAAFDQQLKFPIIQGQTNYFPLRRAANDSQIALGRVFLQEVYLSVDWERDIFNLSQAVFSDRPPPADLVTIDPKNRTDNLVSRPGPGAGRLSPGAIAGVVIAAVVLALLAGGLVWWSRRKQRKAKAKGSVEATQDSALDDKKDHGSFEPGVVSNKPYGQHTDLELDGGMVPEMYAPHGQSEAHHVVGMHDQMMEPIEADSRSPIYELPSPDHHFPKRMG